MKSRGPWARPTPRSLWVEISAVAARYRVRLVTTAYTLIRQAELPGSGPGGRSLALSPGFFEGLANGAYYIEIRAFRHSGAASGPRVVKIFLAR